LPGHRRPVRATTEDVTQRRRHRLRRNLRLRVLLNRNLLCKLLLNRSLRLRVGHTILRHLRNRTRHNKHFSLVNHRNSPERTQGKTSVKGRPVPRTPPGAVLLSLGPEDGAEVTAFVAG